ncbi:uncharacterized protein [Coffea arabica]|uniref:Uncharacterized protein n=1 Tax=Coffea arabica TaxID=13443 RepID=A0ABM4W539_COFAR
MGDFNVVVGSKEKKGGRPFRFSEAESFLNFTDGAGLTDLGFFGSKFTWCNNRLGRARIWKRLDRVLVNQSWLDLGVNTSVAHLSRVSSDHSPLLVTCFLAVGGGPRSFRFLDVWRSHGDFLKVVRQAWEMECEGRSVKVLILKLKAVKHALRVWNKETFGNVTDRVREWEEQVQLLECSLEASPTEEGQQRLLQAQCDLKAALLRESRYWHQKTCIRWLKEGGANTRFFHGQFK